MACGAEKRELKVTGYKSGGGKHAEVSCFKQEGGVPNHPGMAPAWTGEVPSGGGVGV